MATNYNKYINSTGTHYISNSGSDENGNLHSGKAGDQNGKEWRLRSWYKRPWTSVLRHPDATVRQMIAEFGIDAALNDHIGYDQWQRYTYWDALTKSGYRPAKVTTNCEADCTAGVTANVKAVGKLLGIPKLYDIPKDTRSGNMRARFKAADFTVLTASKYLTSPDYLLPGDILLYDNHHAATNITKGKKAAGTVIPTAGVTAKVKVTGATVNVRAAPGVTGKIVGVAKAGDLLPYQGEKKNVLGRDWYLVIYANANAWISSKYSEVV